MKRISVLPIVVGLGLGAAAGNLAAQVTLMTLHSLSGNPSDGSDPQAGLVQGNNGFFYGTTRQGGTNGQGTVFQISPSGSYTILYEFYNNGLHSDGEIPQAVLVQGNDGNFYGTTDGGGTSGDGSVFRISPSGSYTNLHFFSGRPDGADGASGSYAGLIQGSDGNFYGTTSAGGTNTTDSQGTVFQITTKGGVTILHSFIGPPEGYDPYAGLLQGSDGNFYGTTYAGGTNVGGYGTVFKLTTNGILTTLHSFGAGAANGGEPEGGLVQGTDGNLYGTTSLGGTHAVGTVFRISPSGSYTNLYSFGSFTGDGGEPAAGLVQGSDGNFYGTTALYGTHGSHGTVFRISPSGSYSNLYSFSGYPSEGSLPVAGLVQGSDGNFYGTTSQGGTNVCSCGTVFKLVVPLNPPANQISAIQVAGTNVLVSIPSVAAEFYQLQYRDSLTVGEWSNVAGAFAKSIGGSLTVTNFGGFSQSQRFYRFAITL